MTVSFIDSLEYLLANWNDDNIKYENNHFLPETFWKVPENEANNAQTCLIYGIQYRLGIHCRKNIRTSKVYFSDALSITDESSPFFLWVHLFYALWYESEEKYEQMLIKASTVYRMRAAMNELGIMKFKKGGSTQDLEEIEKLFEQSAQLGCLDGIYNYSTMMMNSDQFHSSMATIIYNLLKQAYSAKYKKVAGNLALLEKRYGETQEYKRLLFESTVANKDPSSMLELYKSDNTQIMWLFKAADMNYLPALLECISYLNRDESKLQQEVYYLKKAGFLFLHVNSLVQWIRIHLSCKDVGEDELLEELKPLFFSLEKENIQQLLREFITEGKYSLRAELLNQFIDDMIRTETLKKEIKQLEIELEYQQNNYYILQLKKKQEEEEANVVF